MVIREHKGLLNSHGGGRSAMQGIYLAIITMAAPSLRNKDNSTDVANNTLGAAVVEAQVQAHKLMPSISNQKRYARSGGGGGGGGGRGGGGGGGGGGGDGSAGGWGYGWGWGWGGIGGGGGGGGGGGSDGEEGEGNGDCWQRCGGGGGRGGGSGGGGKGGGGGGGDEGNNIEGRGGRYIARRHWHRHRPSYSSSLYRVGEYARCTTEGRCRGMKLLCPMHCDGPCFYDCESNCRAHCRMLQSTQLAGKGKKHKNERTEAHTRANDSKDINM
ncbi:hypothetical protein ACMD2_10523 [Ananas comosus]|uniref:Uncharacterized protein n=1 Tax=Ananas comosus TaxID=4615 RepID=A0A199V0Y7_ANACO|nr:hypothetical protein ACMD2_10523 [Ananas comosus]